MKVRICIIAAYLLLEGISNKGKINSKVREIFIGIDVCYNSVIQASA